MTFIQGRRRVGLIAGGLIVAGVASFFVWRHFAARESTDDAQVSGHVSPIAAEVGGTVISVQVADNQAVHAGDVLVELDPRDYKVALARAEADLAAAQAVSRAAEANVPITSTTTASDLQTAEAGTGNAQAAVVAAEHSVDVENAKLSAARAHLTEAQANASRAAQDLERLAPLAAKDEVAKQVYDNAVTADRGAKAAVEAAQASVGESQANVKVADAHRTQAEGAVLQARAQASAASTGPQQVALIQARAASARAQVQQAQAVVDQARLNLDRTTVRAPTAGRVSRRTVEVGQVVQPGQALMALTALADVWVTANFKETQLQHMAAGERAEVSVDAYGRTFTGHVDSIAAATGATFSLLPPDNATGNFVKVVQRVPVKIVLDPGQDPEAVLRPGLSVTATVFVR